ncbi:MAG: hypothetical protein FJ279_33190, partial [Planctomycetes bacterium]|nr:hypothetical protein [Planctomycetota bacterium]
WLEGPLNLWATGENWTAAEHLPPLYVEAIRSARAKVEQNAGLGFESRGLFDAVKARAAEKRPTARVARLAQGAAPVIDGKLDDAAWQETPPLSPFIPMLAWRQEVQMATQARIRYDEAALYVAFQCQEDRPHGLVARTAENDDYFLLKDDHVQILIAAPGKDNATVIYRFVLNTKNVTYDALCRENPDKKTRDRDPFVLDLKGFNSGWKCAAQVHADSWTAEAMIPWNALKMPSPSPGAKLSLNLGRYRTQGLNGDRTFWSPVLEMQGDYLERMEPGLFGTVILD